MFHGPPGLKGEEKELTDTLETRFRGARTPYLGRRTRLPCSEWFSEYYGASLQGNATEISTPLTNDGGQQCE